MKIFFPLLAVVFITLKLLGKIDWSWWLVLAPVWGGAILWAIVFVAVIVLAVLIEENDKRR